MIREQKKSTYQSLPGNNRGDRISTKYIEPVITTVSYMLKKSGIHEHVKEKSRIDEKVSS